MVAAEFGLVVGMPCTSARQHTNKGEGNNVSLAINCSNDEDVQSFYEKLSAAGTKEHALEQSFWGATFGDLTDKYGNYWLLNYEKDKN